jgi:hypothetical protein
MVLALDLFFELFEHGDAASIPWSGVEDIGDAEVWASWWQISNVRVVTVKCDSELGVELGSCCATTSLVSMQTAEEVRWFTPCDVAVHTRRRSLHSLVYYVMGLAASIWHASGLPAICDNSDPTVYYVVQSITAALISAMRDLMHCTSGTGPPRATAVLYLVRESTDIDPGSSCYTFNICHHQRPTHDPLRRGQLQRSLRLRSYLSKC